MGVFRFFRPPSPRAARTILTMALSCATAFGEANPYDTDKGYYNTKGAYSQHNSDEVKARLDGRPDPTRSREDAAKVYNDAQAILQRQDEARAENSASCTDVVRCRREAVRLPESFANAVRVREETLRGGVGDTGLVGLDEKLVEVERIARYGSLGSSGAADFIAGQLAQIENYAPSYLNPNSQMNAVHKALSEELNLHQQQANAFEISADWAKRGYKTLIGEANDSPAAGNPNIQTPDAGGVDSKAPASGTPGDIGRGSGGENGRPADPSQPPEYAKAGAPGDVGATEKMDPATLEKGRQMAYDILRAEGITPLGSLRTVGVERGDIAPTGEVLASALKRPDELKSARGAEGAARGARLGERRESLSLRDDEDGVVGPGAGRGAKARRSSARAIVAYDDEEPPPAVLRGLTPSQLKDVKLKWKLFRLTQEREQLLREAGPMISQLRSLGVKATTHGQSIFQLASRNYRTFQRWRKPGTRSAQEGRQPGERSAARGTLPTRPATALTTAQR
jgi:hypothetical protein